VTVYHTDGEVSTIAAATAAPARDPDHLRRLFDDRLERINPGFGFDLIVLEADVVEPMKTVQTRLDGETEDDLQLPFLIDRLTAKFGERAIRVPALRASHIPERAEVAATAMQPAPPSQPPVRNERPTCLLSTPEEVRVLYAVPEGPPVQFIWRRQSYRVTRYAGPERIAPEWWHDRPNTRLRDYFKVEVEIGQRFWLYREGLHDDRRGGDPRWFLHGMFA
jgi:protein ImuB